MLKLENGMSTSTVDSYVRKVINPENVEWQSNFIKQVQDIELHEHVRNKICLDIFLT